MARLLEPSFTQGPNNIMGHACMLCLLYIYIYICGVCLEELKSGYFKTCIDHTVVPLSEHRQPTRGERRMLDTSGARAPGREGKITKLNIVFAVYCAATQEKAWNMGVCHWERPTRERDRAPPVPCLYRSSVAPMLCRVSHHMRAAPPP
jgi:hypothetical protein